MPPAPGGGGRGAFLYLSGFCGNKLGNVQGSWESAPQSCIRERAPLRGRAKQSASGPSGRPSPPRPGRGGLAARVAVGG